LTMAKKSKKDKDKEKPIAVKIARSKFLGGQSTKARKEKWIRTWIRTYSSITKACEIAGVSRQTVYTWRADDDYFRELMDYGELRPVDLAFNKLVVAVGKGEPWAIKHMLENNGHRINYGVVGTTTNDEGEEMPIKEVYLVKND
jgi:hypothetical protein